MIDDDVKRLKKPILIKLVSNNIIDIARHFIRFTLI